MENEHVLSDKEIDELIESSIDKGIAIFSDIWDEIENTEEFDIETVIASVMTECVISLRMQDWSKKEIMENVNIGIDVANEAIKEMKKEDKNV